MDATAIILGAPEKLSLAKLTLEPMGAGDLLVAIRWSGISTGTEKLLWSGRMPTFPGMGYPLVPGYESVGEVIDAGADAQDRIGEWVFVPGARCWRDAHSLFGGSAARVVIPSARAVSVPRSLGESGVLLSLAATARHAIAGGGLPDLIVGHGTLGRLLARLTVSLGGAPVVWEQNAARGGGTQGYQVLAPDADPRRDYRAIYDASGDPAIIDALVGRLARGGEITLAGFYDRLSFNFAPAFMREARVRIAAEFTPADLDATLALIAQDRLRLDGLVTHVREAADAAEAYPAAFSDLACLKMVLDWEGHA